MKRLLLAIPLILCSTAIAQERTAGGTIETQMTWSSLSTQINAVNTKTELVNTRVDQAVVCGKQGMVYAPGAPGNVNGCLPPKTDTNMANQITNLSNTLNNVLTCNKSGMIFNGSGCINATTTSNVPVGTLCGMTSYSSEAGSPLVRTCGGYDPKSGCPAGYSAATIPIYGGKHGQSFGACYKN